jgi:chorismate--pyruvate lyase
MRTRPDRETWRPTPPRATVPPTLRAWLSDPSSLTARIRARCGALDVRVLFQGLGGALRDEAALLGLRAGERVWVREVLLVADGRPVVFARSLLPRRNVRGAWHLFHGIGARPLGAALFADPAIARAPLACTRLDARDARYHRARSALASRFPSAAPGRSLWGRRSLFRLRGRALMVSEFFLPAIFELPR